MISRRSFLIGSAGAAAALYPLRGFLAADGVREFRVKTMAGLARLRGTDLPPTQAWTYNGIVPGPEIRVKQGERIRVIAEYGLAEETTVHWHGIRLPNAMDGVPNMTQKPIAQGESFTYEFTPPDAGTYWYHPHQRSNVQVGRGLFGPLIVEEADPIKVDRDITWLLNDWRLGPDAQMLDDFGKFDDRFNDGHIGDTTTINGGNPSVFAVRAGERIRLRLINAAVARIFRLRFEGHHPRIVAYDGQPVSPHEPDEHGIAVAPSQRVDLIIDMTGRAGETYAVRDKFYEMSPETTLTGLASSQDAPLRAQAPNDPIQLPANKLPEPDLSRAERLPVIFGGGGMANGVMWGCASSESVR